MAAAPWSPPPEPDLAKLAKTGWANWTIDMPKVIAFDTETTGFGYNERAFGASIAWHHDDVIAGPMLCGHWFDFDRVDCREAVRQIVAHADVLVAHNAKFDMHKLEREHITIRPDQILHDTECMAHLDDEHRRKGLKDLAVSVLKFDDTIEVPTTKKDEAGAFIMKKVPQSKWEIDKARAWVKKEQGFASIDEVSYDLIPRGTLVPYAILDAVWTLELASVLLPRIIRYPDLHELYEREMLLTRGAIYAMEKAGMGVRTDYLRAEILNYRKAVVKHELDIEGIVGKPVRSGKIPPKERDQFFNPASNPDVGNFFNDHGFSEDSYDAATLKTMDHPLARELVSYRQDNKILNSYLASLLKDVGGDGIFHQSLRQHGTVSGRTSGGAERGDQ